MNKIFFSILFFALAAYAQQKVAIMNTEDDGEPPLKHQETSTLTAKLREIAMKTLPKDRYDIMTEQSIVSYLGSTKEVARVCKAADGCLAKIGRDIEADFIGQARISRFGKFFTIKVEIYNVIKGTLVGTFTDQSSEDIYALLTVVDKKAPDMFREMLGAAVVASVPATTFPITTDVTSKPNDHECGRSTQEIMQVVNARMPGLRNIYNKYLKLKPGFSGKVPLKFTISPSGDIISISIVNSTTGYPDFDNAVKSTVATWKWKEIKCGNTTPTIPFNFTE